MISTVLAATTARKIKTTDIDNRDDVVDAVSSKHTDSNAKPAATTSRAMVISSTGETFSGQHDYSLTTESTDTANQEIVTEAMLDSAVQVLVEAEVGIAPTLSAPGEEAGESQSNRNVTAQDIEGLFYQSALDFGTIGLNLLESTVLLLKNGMAYIGLRKSPLELVAPRQSNTSNGSWAPWRNTTGTYELLNSSGSWRSIDGVRVDRTPLTPAEVAGSYERVRTQNWGGTIFTDRQNITLTEQGEFLTSASTLASSGGLGSQSPGTSLSFYKEEDATGSTTIASGNSANGAASAVVASTQQMVSQLGNRLGYYSFLEDGLTVEFCYANGDVRRELFFRVNDSVYVGDKSYSYASTVNDDLEVYVKILFNSLFLKPVGGSERWLAGMAKAQEKHGKADSKVGITHTQAGDSSKIS